MRWGGGSSGNGIPRRVGGSRQGRRTSVARGEGGGGGMAAARRKKPSKKLPREATSRRAAKLSRSVINRPGLISG